ncbi:hypothetical protein M9Y10_023858 [Tritrichomonas musculus]|uniref:SET domain-containing protein n=1 Tax=Tritrichomonas musculus TaxID=1915356 RepID=A0ABR2KWC0_9EUKA
MNDFDGFMEYDDYDEVTDEMNEEEKTKCDTFPDPFFDIGPYLSEDPEISNNPNLSELVFFLKSAWLDPYFYRNRTLCCLPSNDYLPEEKGLLILIQKLLNLEEDTPLDPYLLTVFCMITGRCSELLQFDKVTLTNINKVNFRCPYRLYSQPGEGPCCISPYLIILAINETVTFPSIISHLITRKSDFPRSDKLESFEEVTTDLHKSFSHAQREPPKVFPISFDSGLTLTNYITRFPTLDGGFWVRVTCEPFSIAYGDDITNGKGQVKFPWTNRFNGQHPPTLSEQGIGAEVEWIDTKINEITDDQLSREDSHDLQHFCPRFSDDYEAAFKNLLARDYPEITNYTALWADPDTSRIRAQDLNSLQTEEGLMIVVECNNLCKCNRNCPFCFTSQPQFPHLMLFYSPDKGWGVVATEDIEPGTLITTYAGETRTAGQSREFGNNDAVYYFAVEFGDQGDILEYHALHKCNIGRFINQTHETPTETETPFTQPNAIAINIFSSLIENCIIGIFSKRKIYKGEEISIFYGDHYNMTKKCACNICLRNTKKYKEVLNDIDNPVMKH